MRLGAALVIAAVAAGCMGEKAADAPSTSSTDLRISFSERKGGTVLTTSVACTDRVTTSAEKCERLAALDRNAFAPVPANMACAEIFGGPQVAEVSGIFKGQRIDAEFNRTNACEIARWDRVRFLFPPAPR